MRKSLHPFEKNHRRSTFTDNFGVVIPKREISPVLGSPTAKFNQSEPPDSQSATSLKAYPVRQSERVIFQSDWLLGALPRNTSPAFEKPEIDGQAEPRGCSDGRRRENHKPKVLRKASTFSREGNVRQACKSILTRYRNASLVFA